MATEANFVNTTTNSTTSIAATTVVVVAASSPFNSPIDPSGDTATLILLDDPDTPTKLEIITYTGRTGAGPYTLTGVTKGVDGTSDQSWASGSHVIQTPTAALIASLYKNGGVLTSYGETEVAKGSVSGAQTFNTANGNMFSLTATGAITLTFTNAFDTTGFTVIVTNAGTNLTFPASVEWAGGTAPTLTTTGVDILSFITNDGGTTWYGFLGGADFS